MKTGHASGLLSVNQRDSTIVFGGAKFTRCPIILQIDDEDIICVGPGEQQNLSISLSSYDAVGNMLFSIQNNIWTTGYRLPWDLDAKWRHVTLRHKMRDVFFEIDARGDNVTIAGHFKFNGTLVKANSKEIRFGGSRIGAASITGALFGICIKSGRPRIFPSMGTRLDFVWR